MIAPLGVIGKNSYTEHVAVLIEEAQRSQRKATASFRGVRTYVLGAPPSLAAAGKMPALPETTT